MVKFMKKKYYIVLISLLLLLSISSVNASEKISATPNEYFTFYGVDTPAGQTHSFGIEVDSKVYYISDSIASKLASFSSNFGEAYHQTYGQNLEGMTDFKNDEYFDFEYISGQQVGFNSNANIITKVYYPDGKEIK